MMLLCLLCWWFYYLTEAISDAETCWETTDVRSKEDVFIRCPNSTIMVKDIRMDKDIGYAYRFKNTCRSVYRDSYMKELWKCNGLYDVCGVHDVDILAVTKVYADGCNNVHQYLSLNFTLRVCIIYDCIHGQMNNLIHSTTVTKARGSLYQAVQLKGFLRCAIHGHITNVTVMRSKFLRLSVRDANGDEFLKFEGTHYSSRKTILFESTKNAINKDALEITMYTEVVTYVTLIVEGGKYYKCRNTTMGLDSKHQAENKTAIDKMCSNYENATYGLESNQTEIDKMCSNCQNATYGLDSNQTEIDEMYYNCQNGTFRLESNHQSENWTETGTDRHNFQGVSVNPIPWILTSISMTLSLVLAIICVTLCLLRKNNKTVTEESQENEIPSVMFYDHHQESYFESQMYMENRF